MSDDGGAAMRGTVDRALSATTRPAAGAGASGPTAETVEKYWVAWHAVEAWRTARRETLPDGRVVAPSIMPMSSETLAEYMAHMASQGLSRSSLGRARAAIRWRHREQGQPVPDGVPSLGVLRDHETSREQAGVVVRHTVAMPLGDLVTLVVRSCDRATPQGLRDAALLLLAYAAKLSRLDLYELNLADLRPVTDDTDGEIEVRVGRRRGLWVRVPHWQAHTGKHSPVCPVEAVWQWSVWLRQQGAPVASPLWRPIDAVHRLSGIDPVRMGKHPVEGRLSKDGLGKVMTAALHRAGMGQAGYDLRSLRKGGAAADRAGGVPQAAIAELGGWQVTTSTFQDAMAQAEQGGRGRAGAHRLPPPPADQVVQPSLFDTLDP